MSFEVFHPVDHDSGMTRMEEMYGKGNIDKKVIPANGTEVDDLAKKFERPAEDIQTKATRTKEFLEALKWKEGNATKKEPPPTEAQFNMAFNDFPLKISHESELLQAHKAETVWDSLQA